MYRLIALINMVKKIFVLLVAVIGFGISMDFNASCQNSALDFDKKSVICSCEKIKIDWVLNDDSFIRRKLSFYWFNLNDYNNSFQRDKDNTKKNLTEARDEIIKVLAYDLYKIQYRNEKVKVPNTIPNIPNSWVREDVGINSDLIIKKPFDTYINESKNFDVMFGLREISNLSYSNWAPFLVVKNYLQKHEFNSVKMITLVIGDEEIELSETYNGFGRIYDEKKMAITSSSREIIAYRTVVIYKFDLNYILYQKDKNNELMSEYLDNLIKNMQVGKVFINYETSTGKIKRSFNESQITSFKELIRIYKYFLNKKPFEYEEGYTDENLKQQCADLEIELKKYQEDVLNDPAKYYPYVNTMDSIINLLK